MCTLIVAVNHFADTALVVAANRDERYDRPSEAPHLVEVDGRKALMPSDSEAGGTWLGVSMSGFFVALTNRFGSAPRKERRSRGLLVRDLLLAVDHRQAVKMALAVDVSQYNTFHLVVSDGQDVLVLVNDGVTLKQHIQPVGVLVVTERSYGAAPSERPRAVERAFAQLSTTQRPTPEQLRCVLNEHRETAFESTCVHMPQFNYGTRSSTLIVFEGKASVSKFWYADGPPCQHDYQDMSPLLLGVESLS